MLLHFNYFATLVPTLAPKAAPKIPPKTPPRDPSAAKTPEKNNLILVLLLFVTKFYAAS
jgi:hypothetical protein